MTWHLGNGFKHSEKEDQPTIDIQWRANLRHSGMAGEDYVATNAPADEKRSRIIVVVFNLRI